jgi:cellulose synthase (UDP-forming)
VARDTEPDGTAGGDGARRRVPEPVVRVVAAATLAWGAAYLGWRLLATGHGVPAVAYWPLLAAEAFGWANLAAYTFMAWRVPPPRRLPPPDDADVDVFVCTYDEPVRVVEATLAGCAAIRFPHTTWVLDDGRRPEIAALAADYGARYLTRPDNRHAKAGNINHALGRTSGEFVLVLDADHVPQPDILDATLGHFRDPRVALVQTPHDFFNRDSFQHTRVRRHEQSLFYEVLAPGKDRHNGVFWCGSAAVIRRVALEQVGGVLTDTIAEDFHTTLAMHARGWRTRYHGETLVQGLAPHDLASFLLQRDRWARGNLRVLRTPQSPLSVRGLDWRQRCSYLGSLANYFAGPQRLVLLTVLVATLVSGVLPFHAHPAELLAVWAPWVAGACATTVLLARGTLGLADSTVYGMLTMGIFTRAVGSLALRGTGRFPVTPKEGVDLGGLRALRLLPVLVAAGAALAAAVAGRALAALGMVPLPPLSGFALAATLALGCFELAFVARTLVPVVRRRQRRGQYRVPVALTARIAGTGAIVPVEDLTPEGLSFDTTDEHRPGDQLRLHLRVPDARGEPAPVEVEVEVRSLAPAGDGRHRRAGCRIRRIDAASRRALVEFCHVVRPAELLGRIDAADADRAPEPDRAPGGRGPGLREPA